MYGINKYLGGKVMPIYERELVLSRGGESSGYILIAITFDRQYVAVYDKASAGSGGISSF